MNILPVMYGAEYILRCMTPLKKFGQKKIKKPPAQTDEAEGTEFTDNVIERRELSILLNLALAKLTHKQRQTITALYFEWLNGKETAQVLNCAPCTVTKHHKLALKNLKAKLA